MSDQPSKKATIQVWRDPVLNVAGNPVLWVVLVEQGIVRETLNKDREKWFTDPAEAILFAASEAKTRGIGWEPRIRQI
ncbi:MAG: hypothetical protein ACREFO_19790 [Acetobacteraceae bacterium]